MSTISSNTDFSAKYQRIATEYAKLKAQVSILKNAVIDEQTRNKNNVELLQTKETSIRKLASENESLTFRNDQLLKRVECLQADMTVMQKSASQHGLSRGAVFRQANSHANVAILENELMIRVRENESLRNEISQLESAHANQLCEANKVCENLRADNRSLQIDVDRLLKCTSEEPTQSVEAQPENSIHKETADSVAGCSDRGKDTTQLLVLDSVRIVHAMISSFINLLQLFEQRSVIYPKDINMESLPQTTTICGTSLLQSVDAFEKFRSQLVEVFALYSKEEHMDFIEECYELLPIYANAVCSNERWIESYCEIVEQENRLYWCTSNLYKVNSKWCSIMNSLVSELCSMSVALSERSNIPIVRSLQHLQRLLLDATDVFGGKLFAENCLPTVSKRLKCVNECIDKCIRSIARNCCNLTSFISLINDLGREYDRSESSHYAVCSNRIDAANDQLSRSSALPIERHKAECSSWCGNDVDCASAEENCNAEAMERIKRKLITLEIDKERWMAENQILKSKLTKELSPKLDGEGIISESDELAMLSAYYENRIRNLLVDLQYLEGQALYYKGELEDGVIQKDTIVSENSELRTQLAHSSKQIASLKEDLNTVNRNYEDQMRVLYEHMDVLKLNSTSHSAATQNLPFKSSANGAERKNYGKSLFK